MWFNLDVSWSEYGLLNAVRESKGALRDEVMENLMPQLKSKFDSMRIGLA
jgi:hypothetical protein